MKTVLVFITMFLILFGLTNSLKASEYDILRPGVVQNDLDVKAVKSFERRSMSPDRYARLRPDGLFETPSILDTLTWRSKSEPDVNFGFLNFDDSLLVWFKPLAACSLIALRFYVIDHKGHVLLDVWDGSRYDPKIYSTDSVDANGWIGGYDPYTGEWIPGIFDHSPLGWDPQDPNHHYWGPFPYTLTTYHEDIWIEIPAALGIQGEIDLGKEPFYISSPFWILDGWGFGAEYPWTTPYNFFKYYSYCCGPDGVHDGWFLRSYFIWFEAIVKYYENTPPKYENLKIQNDTYAPGPFPITVTITDADAENETMAGVASAELVYDMNGVIYRRMMSGSPEGGLFTAEIPELTQEAKVTYWVEAIDLTGNSSQSSKVTFSRIEPVYQEADVLVVWDWWTHPELDSFYFNLFDFIKNEDDKKYEFELWNYRKHQGIDASVLNWGWKTIIVSGHGCANTLPGRDYTDNLFVQWLETGTIDKSHNLLYIDQDYFCTHPEYECSWSGALTEGDFLHDYMGVASAISDYGLSGTSGYDSVAIGDGDFAGIRVNFFPSAWDPTYPEYNLWPDWIVELAESAEQIFHYKDHPNYGAGIRLDRGHYKTIYLPWQDFFAVDSSENGDLVPRPDLVETYEKMLEWFMVAHTGTSLESNFVPNEYSLRQNYPNPFNASTDIRYQIPDSRSPLPTTLKIYNILGQEIKIVINEEQASGQYTAPWDGLDMNGVEAPSGVYFYQLRSGTFIQTKKMLLLK